VQSGPQTTRWVPGLNDPANLGGTIRTLDQVTGPVSLGQGVLSRSGWALIDDSQDQLLTPDAWVESRPDTQKAGLDWYFFGYGSNYRAALSSLMTVSGSVPLPRRYALGIWYSRYWPWSEDDYKNIVGKYKTEDFPLDNVVLDMDWHKEGWTGWSWNTQLLPDAPGLLSWMHSQGLHDTLNLHPADGVAPFEDQYAPFMNALQLDPKSQTTVPFDTGSKQYMTALFNNVLDPLKKDGVDFWWLDWQQYPYTRSIPDLTNLFWFNTLLYNYTAENDQRGMSFSRWAGWGDQRHPIHFSGDAYTGFSMLAFEVPFTSTAGNVGCFFWSHDIGGHMGGRNEESYARWCQFGATSPVLRSHSTRDALTDRAPWNYPKWAEDSMRISAHLRSQLFPYIYTSSEEACAQNVPLDRPVYLDLPNIDAAYHNGQEYLLGDNILVAPIATAGAGSGHVSYQTVWLPPTQSGYWYNLFTGEREKQQSNAVAASSINEFPIYARGGVPLPLQPYTPRMGTNQVSTLRLRVYPGADGQIGKSSLYEDDGVTTAYRKGQSATTTFTCVRQGSIVKLIVAPTSGHYVNQPSARGYLFELPDTDRPAAVSINGQKTSFDYDRGTFTATISIPAYPINKTITLAVTGYHPDGWEFVHSKAETTRLAGSISSGGAFTGSSLTILEDSLAAAASPQEQAAALAAYGIAVDHKNVTTDFYPQAYQDQLFVPYGVVDNNKVTLGDGSILNVGPDGISGYPIPPASGIHGKVSFQIAGKSYTLPAPAHGVGSDDNVALFAVPSVSSVQPGTQSVASAVNDGAFGGYPNHFDSEWASNAEKSGAWVRLDWAAPQTTDQIWLYDRPNPDDQVTSGTITFSDGSSVDFGALPNDGSAPLVVKFSQKTINWLKLTVTGTSSSTQNIGLSEIAVIKAGSSETP
jgi:alpha-glucosidase (family GH31 glycosyl hydrolase)